MKKALLLLAGAVLFSCATTNQPNGAPAAGVSASYAEAARGADHQVFPPPLEDADRYLENDVSGISFSLAAQGDEVDPELDRIAKSAVFYYYLSEYEITQLLCNYSVYFAAVNGLPLQVDQLDSILLVRAYALADSERMEMALAIYDFRLDMLLDRNEWRTKLPAGLPVTAVAPGEYITNRLAGLYRDRMLAYTILGDFGTAWEELQAALEISEQMGWLDSVVVLYDQFITNCFYAEAWEFIDRAQEPYQIAQSQYPPEPELLMRYFRYTALAWLKLGYLQNAYGFAEQLVSLKERLNYSDEFDQADREMRDGLAEVLDSIAREEGTLIAFAQVDDPAEVARLLEEGADPNEVHTGGWTALMWAAGESATGETVRLLLDAGADPNASNTEGYTPLMLAARSNPNPEVVRLLLERGADPNTRGRNNSTALSFAAGYTDNVEAVRLLLAAGADPNAQSGLGWSALMLVARLPTGAEVTRLLLEAGADPNLRTTDGLTALRLAEDMGHTEVAEVLREFGAQR
jgi:tetratricopeptide (TPR) repeat protein